MKDHLREQREKFVTEMREMQERFTIDTHDSDEKRCHLQKRLDKVSAPTSMSAATFAAFTAFGRGRSV